MKRYTIDRVEDFQYVLTKEDHYNGNLTRDMLIINTLQIKDEYSDLMKTIELGFDKLFKVEIDNVQK
jgi:hypothetical protein